ncbi:hypothetical protein HPB49_026553 [Dermacentor silvarum]|uniref:uncharacterized protein LOC125941996 n=1 Tax=Dermacentor silvarum TaxID=543639 RepID=UPI002100B6B6|nr:uncharacterized protein LOC125941996 [Dermacentor silvarum]KAH7985200.1 hypothetical protein HPB49_026553 [Dermacentor silvarum]
MGEKQPTTVKELAKVLNELTANVATLGENVKDVKTSIQFMSDKFDTIQTSLSEVCAELRNLQREHTTLKKENAELKKELADTRADLIELKQYSRQNNIEIKGLPHDPSERPEAIIQVLGEKLGTKIETAEIDVVHRVPTKEKGKTNVIVRFVSRSSRNKVLQAAKKKRLTTADFGFEGTNAVYINEHLCLENKILLGKATQLRKEKQWKFSWVSQGKILVRKTETSSVIHISRESDLAKIV